MWSNVRQLTQSGIKFIVTLIRKLCNAVPSGLRGLIGTIKRLGHDDKCRTIAVIKVMLVLQNKSVSCDWTDPGPISKTETH